MLDENTTEKEFWKKYNHCPFCREYEFQSVCNLCKYFLNGDKTKADLFYPKSDFENYYFNQLKARE